MNDLNLPSIKANPIEKRVLSMDEYYEFVRFNLSNSFNKESYLRWKKMLAVYEPFIMR